tara:strand:+ start:465 stop:692 length:228 start_codon:yes stop_codon:yes gene_type:complete
MKAKYNNFLDNETLYERFTKKAGFPPQVPSTIYHEELVERSSSDGYDPYAYVEDKEQEIKFYDYSLTDFDWVGDD